MHTKTERITLLGSRAFKAFLAKESLKEGVSVSELVRRRCERAPTEDERVLLALADELRKSTAEARQALHGKFVLKESKRRELSFLSFASSQRPTEY